MKFTKRVCESILPRSVADTLPEALREWHFTEAYNDCEEAIETCEMCGKEQIRYQFEIRNKYTNRELWVGSQCILRFDVQVYDGEALLDAVAAEKKLKKISELMRLESCLRALTRLAQEEKNDILTGALDYYQKNKALSPKLAFIVFWRLKAHRIDHSPTFFKISLKRAKYQHDLRSMPTDRVQLFWRALTVSQRKMAIEYGHAPPEN